MGKTHYRTYQGIRKGGSLRVYDEEELYALNAYLLRRDDTNLNGARNSLKHVSRNFYIARINDLDWMVKKKGPVYVKMFCMESWKRFNFGEKRRAKS